MIKQLFKYLLLAVMVISCSKDKELDFRKIYVREKETSEFKTNYYILFAKNNREQICLVEPWEILYVRKKSKVEERPFKDFNDILHQRILIDIDSTDHVCFSINKKIEDDFLKLDRKAFLDKYTKRADKKRYLINYKLDNDETLNVGYFLFKNGFGISFDDYLGSYYVHDLVSDL